MAQEALLLGALALTAVVTAVLVAMRSTSRVEREKSLRTQAEAKFEGARFSLEAAEETKARLEEARTLLEAARQEKTEAVTRLAERETALENANGELASARATLETLSRDKTHAETQLKEREKSLEELRTRFETEFKAIAAQTLEATHDAFIKRADETFQKHQQSAVVEAEKRHKAVDELVKPISETLSRYETGLKELRENEAKQRGELFERISDLGRRADTVRDVTNRLENALRASPKARGRWGEETLQNIIELIGLTRYCDFKTQDSVEHEGQRKQPDVVVSLPGARTLLIDAKVSLSAYMDAIDASEAETPVLLKKHSEEMWAHVKSLASKDYASAYRDSLDFVVMFVPGEHFFSAAVEHRPTIVQEAFDKSVIIATPTNLYAVLKSVAYGWRQEKAAENARHVARLGQELYKSLQRTGTNLARLGGSLSTVIGAYNSTIGNIEGNVLPKARKFVELEVEGADGEIPALEPIETTVREPREDGKDLLFSEDPQPAPAEPAIRAN